VEGCAKLSLTRAAGSIVAHKEAARKVSVYAMPAGKEQTAIQKNVIPNVKIMLLVIMEYAYVKEKSKKWTI
jgi:hypothetical protein